MSVIFQTLKKIEQQTGEKSPGPRQKRVRKSSLTGRLLQTPLGMGIFLGSIFLTGFLLLYGLDRLSTPRREARESTFNGAVEIGPTQTSKLSEAEVSEVMLSDFSQDADAAEMAPATPTVIGQDDSRFSNRKTQADTFFPPKEEGQSSFSPPHRSIQGPEEKAAQYSVPQKRPSELAILSSATVDNSAAEKTAGQPEKAASAIFYEPTPGNQSNLTVKSNPRTAVALDVPEKAAPADAGKGRNVNLIETNGSVPQIAVSKGKDHLNSAADSASAKLASVVEPPPDRKQQERLANLDKFRKTARKRAAIAQLVAQLEGAIERADEPEVKSMLHRLAAKKGENDLYVLNLKAFWYLKQERYPEAESLLLKILESDQDHLEAGLNLAIVEAKTQRRGAALKRLERLRELYADNQVVADMIRKLR